MDFNAVPVKCFENTVALKTRHIQKYDSIYFRFISGVLKDASTCVQRLREGQ